MHGVKMRQIFVFFCVLLFLLQLQTSKAWSFWKSKDEPQLQLSPVVFVPGDGGSQIEARLSKSKVPNYLCYKSYDWFPLWLNLELLAPILISCFVDNMKLEYDNVTRTTHNTQGVEIRIPGWADSSTVEWIDATKAAQGAYFKDIANMLVNDLGYERKKNLHGAPYDFRKAPNELHQFFVDLKELIRYTYERNGNSSVTLITHSMGSPLTLTFLHEQETSWKQKYVKRIISLAGAWGGSIKALKVFAMGDDLDSFVLNSKILKIEQISSPSTAWLLPSPLFWSINEPLIETPKRRYTVNDLESYFNDIDYRIGWEMRKDTMPYTLNYSPPDVELHCLYGDGVPTVDKLIYKTNDISREIPTLHMGTGDGTVNSRSLRGCQHWEGYQDYNISNKALNGVNHLGILAHKTTIDYIKSVMSS